MAFTKKITAAEFERRAHEVHHGRYRYDLDTYRGTQQSMSIDCPEHGPFEQRPSHHISRRQGCPACGKKREPTRTREQFISEASARHKDFYRYLIDTESVLAASQITIECPTHGRFRQGASHHLRGRRCRRCTTEQNADRKRLDNDGFIARAQKTHGDRYGYEAAIYLGNQTPVTITCHEHGSFDQAPHSHWSGAGCPICARIGQSEAATKTTDDFVRDARTRHGDLFDYSNTVYAGSHGKVTIGCRAHGKFSQSATSHLSGHGCPRCSGTVSKLETKWLDAIEVPVRQHSIAVNGWGRNIRVDGFDPATNTVFLFHGDYWHGNPRKFAADSKIKSKQKTAATIYAETLALERELRLLGYRVVAMWEDQFKHYDLGVHWIMSHYG